MDEELKRQRREMAKVQSEIDQCQNKLNMEQRKMQESKAIKDELTRSNLAMSRRSGIMNSKIASGTS